MANLWSEDYSLVFNTVGSEAKKAQLVQKAHESAEQKAERITKEEKEAEEKKAKRIFNSEITFNEAVLHWNLEDLAILEEALIAKFELQEAKIEWELVNDKVDLN